MDESKLKVSLRDGFSDRNGIKSENVVMQFNELDHRTRVTLSNVLNRSYNELFSFDYYSHNEQTFLRTLLSEVYCQELDYSKNCNPAKSLSIMRETIMNDDYDSVLTLLEFVFRAFTYLDSLQQYNVGDELNRALKKEYVGYRFVKGIIVPITNEEEIGSLSETLDCSEQKVVNHFKKAASLLSNRTKPDYENSIKESITAVEAMCEAILGEKGTLGQCLSKLEEKGVSIHKALKEAFKKLYGYTSDASGIRHAGDLDAPTATFAEAKYMLVSCSAFINYLNELAF